MREVQVFCRQAARQLRQVLCCHWAAVLARLCPKCQRWPVKQQAPPAQGSQTKAVLPYYLGMGCLAWLQCLTLSCTSAAEVVT